MTDLGSEIAIRLGSEFARAGFAGSSVDQLRTAAGVSLRTLYRHFPSREAMVLSALSVRHDAYLAKLRGACPTGKDGVLALYQASGEWLSRTDGTGCLFLRAKAEHPESEEITRLVDAHKQAIRDLVAERLTGVIPTSAIKDMTAKLYMLLEGQTFAAMTQPADKVTRHTLATANTLLDKAIPQ